MSTRPLTAEAGQGPPPRSALAGVTRLAVPLEMPAAIRPDRRPESGWKRMARGDATLGFGVLTTTALLWPSPGGTDPATLVRRTAMAIACWALLEGSLFFRGTYARARRQLILTIGGNLGSIIAAGFSGMIAALAILEVLPNSLRFDVSPASVIAPVGAWILVLLLGRAITSAPRRGRPECTRVLVVGNATMATDAAVRIVRQRHLELVGFVGDDPSGRLPILGHLDALALVCQNLGVDHVLVATTHDSKATGAALASLPESVKVHVIPPYLELGGWWATVEDLGGITVVTVEDGPPSRAGRVAKRILDVAVSLVGLAVLAPVLAAVAVAVRLSSPGPALFRQTRIGRDGSTFSILKFRSMRQSGNPSDLDSDSRITTVGRYLRRSGVDEIPQLLNVLSGQMSLVGPRPLIPEESAALPSSADRRFEVRPGMTGLWQICGQHDLRWEEMCRLDAGYVANWSFRSDLRILTETPRRLLRGDGGAGARWKVPAAAQQQ